MSTEDTLIDQMRLRARWVTGRGIWERDVSDPRVETAVSDAKLFWDQVKKDVCTPDIYGGTTCNPDDILILNWTYVRGPGQWAQLRIRFKGDGTCDLLWNGWNEAPHRHDGIPVAQLAQFDVPRKVKMLQKPTIGD